MKKSILLCLVMLLGITSGISAQGLYIQDVNGSPVRVGTYTNVTGSPYRDENWIKANIKMANGKVFNSVDIKYDQVEDQLIYRGTDGQAMNFVDKIAEFNLLTSDGNTTVFKKGFPASKGITPENYAEVLVEGKTKLLKRTAKHIQESREYNSATVDRTITSTTLYYLVGDNGEIANISKDKKSILKALPAKSSELEQYISSNKLNLKEDQDLVKLITYYNSL